MDVSPEQTIAGPCSRSRTGRMAGFGVAVRGPCPVMDSLLQVCPIYLRLTVMSQTADLRKDAECSIGGVPQRVNFLFGPGAGLWIL